MITAARKNITKYLKIIGLRLVLYLNFPFTVFMRTDENFTASQERNKSAGRYTRHFAAIRTVAGIRPFIPYVAIKKPFKNPSINPLLKSAKRIKSIHPN